MFEFIVKVVLVIIGLVIVSSVWTGARRGSLTPPERKPLQPGRHDGTKKPVAPPSSSSGGSGAAGSGGSEKERSRDTCTALAKECPLISCGFRESEQKQLFRDEYINSRVRKDQPQEKRWWANINDTRVRVSKYDSVSRTGEFMKEDEWNINGEKAEKFQFNTFDITPDLEMPKCFRGADLSIFP